MEKPVVERESCCREKKLGRVINKNWRGIEYKREEEKAGRNIFKEE